jgi:hypothetical protein
MSTAGFEIMVDGRPATFDSVLPELTVNDRVGVVTQSPGGSLAAAPLLLASVARYYELLRGRGDKFYRYPGYYVIHVGRQHAYHGWLDVWSANKEVVVASHGEAVLEALNDRAITRVVLEDAGKPPPNSSHGLPEPRTASSRTRKLRKSSVAPASHRDSTE